MPDGSDWLVYHAWDAVGQPRYGQNPSGRTLRIDRIEWHGDTPRILGPTVTPFPAPDARPKAPPGTAPGRISALDEQYNALDKAFSDVYFATKDEAARREISRRLRPDAAGYAHRFLGLAKEDPAGSGAADALYNVLMLQQDHISPDGQEALTWLARDFVTSPGWASSSSNSRCKAGPRSSRCSAKCWRGTPTGPRRGRRAWAWR